MTKISIQYSWPRNLTMHRTEGRKRLLLAVGAAASQAVWCQASDWPLGRQPLPHFWALGPPSSSLPTSLQLCPKLLMGNVAMNSSPFISGWAGTDPQTWAVTGILRGCCLAVHRNRSFQGYLLTFKIVNHAGFFGPRSSFCLTSTAFDLAPSLLFLHILN